MEYGSWGEQFQTDVDAFAGSVCVGGGRSARGKPEKADGAVKYVKRTVKLSRRLPVVADNVSRVLRSRHVSFLLTIARAVKQEFFFFRVYRIFQLK